MSTNFGMFSNIVKDIITLYTRGAQSCAMEGCEYAGSLLYIPYCINTGNEPPWSLDVNIFYDTMAAGHTVISAI